MNEREWFDLASAQYLGFHSYPERRRMPRFFSGNMAWAYDLGYRLAEFLGRGA